MILYLKQLEEGLSAHFHHPLVGFQAWYQNVHSLLQNPIFNFTLLIVLYLVFAEHFEAQVDYVKFVLSSICQQLV